MKNKKTAYAKRALTMLAAALLLASCNGNNNNNAGNSSASSAGPAAGVGMYPIEGSVKLTMAKAGDLAPSEAGYTSYSETPGFKAWQEQTGVTIELSEPMDNSALLLMLASDTVPDIVVCGKNTYPGGVMKMVEDGLAINLSEHMDDWCPDYKALLNSSEQYSIAAKIDGAGRFRQTLHVTLPGIAGTVILLLILRMGSILNVGYEKIILLQNDYNLETSDVISSFVYRKGLVNGDYSYSAAVGLFNSVINFTLVMIANKISSKVSGYGIW